MRSLLLALSFLSCIAYSVEFQSDLIGGVPVKPGDFPEVVYISNGDAYCSATIIGPQVIMTAGHCVSNGGKISQVSFNVTEIGQAKAKGFSAVCENDPLYFKKTEDLDFSLCQTTAPIKVKYASIALKAPKIKDPITLSGYGCITPVKPDGSGGTGGNDGILRWGEAPVTGLPTGTFDFLVVSGKAALCFGDSGGPAFLHIVSPQKEKHYVIGVNSQGDIKTVSYLTALWLEKSQAFFRDFAARHKVEICGINKTDC